MSGQASTSDPAEITLKLSGRLIWILQALLVALALRCAYLQIWRGPELAEKQTRSLRRAVRLPALRGSIRTRDGLLLAHDVPVWHLGIDPQVAGGDPQRLSPSIRESLVRAALRELDFPAVELRAPVDHLEELATTALESGGRYVRLGQITSYEDYQDFVRWRRERSQESGRALATCFTVDLGLRRHHPQGTLGMQVVGITNSAGVGLTGIEAAREDQLRGVAGFRDRRRTPGGRLSGEAEDGLPVIDGDDVVLTLDARLQALLERWLVENDERTGARGSLGVVLDPRSGAVLAMASTPFLDPDGFSRLTDAERGRQQLQVTHAVYEPGSTIKGLVFAEALAAGIDPVRMITDGHQTWQVGHRTIRDSSRHEPLSVEGSVIYSSNIGMARLGRLLGPRRLQRCIQRFRLGEPTGIEIYEERGIRPSVRTWRSGTTLSVPFGYEIAPTPLQIARGYCSLVNGGFEITPHVVHGGASASAGAEERVVPAWVSDRVRETLRKVVLVGTGRHLDGELIGLAGKTGTAKVNENKVYVDGLYRSSFLGFAPWDEPRFLALVVVDRPQGEYYGGLVAGPVVRKVMGFLMGEECAELRAPLRAARRESRDTVGTLEDGHPTPIMPAGTQKGEQAWYAPEAR